MFHDARWHGAPANVDAALAAIAAESIIGPIVLDGVDYVAVRALVELQCPAALSVTGQQLSLVVLGTWSE